ncbi:MAG: alpha/beta fold hydrolase [Acidimicrobiia bacterium]|nr:alpha/beta fold hydrolase [Acidimicrobiia bacterium]
MTKTPESPTSRQSDEEIFRATIDEIWALNPMFGPSPFADIEAEPTAFQQLGAAMITKPGAALRRVANLAMESAKIAMGVSDIDLSRDRRFRHERYESNPILRRIGQQYLAWRETVHGYIDDLEVAEGAERQGHFLADLITEAAAPTNTLLGNPAAIEEAIETRGRSLLRGFRNWIDDQANNGGLPSMVDREPFRIGETIATTPGEVVFRNEVLELMRYAPTTAKVRKRPIVIVPPQINKYYILDLAPGRSLVEALVAEGQQVFTVSWRNVSADQRHWDMDYYVVSLIEAIDAARALTKQETVNLLGVCAGGITVAVMLGYLSAIGDEKVNAVSYLVTGLDWGAPTLLASMVGGANAGAVVQRSQTAGVLSGRDLSQLFAFLRPNDLVWNYWVNNYLMGRKPPAFDVLAWNVDSTNMPAGLHADFMSISSQNTLTVPGGYEILGEKVDLRQVRCDTYVVGGETDHITPWESCLSTINIVGGESEFVLCKSGHVQTIVCPPDNPKARYMIVDDADRAGGASRDGKREPFTPDSWLDAATEHTGSWWTHWFEWLGKRSDGLVNAPKRLDSADFASLGPAPGTYVHQTA